MSIKKDQLKQAFTEISKPNTRTGEQANNRTPEPIAPLSLDPTKRGDSVVDNTTTTPEIKPPKKQVKVKLPKAKWGVVNTTRYSFEITPELKDKLNRRLAEIQLTTGKKVSASEVIRQALARELREL